MGPAVVLGQDLSEVAGPVRDGAMADLAAGDRKLGNGHREAAGKGLAHLPLWCQARRSDLAPCSRRTHAARQMRAFSVQRAMHNYAGWSGRLLDRTRDCRTNGKAGGFIRES